MRFKKIIIASFLLSFLWPIASSRAYWVWSPEQGKFVNTETGTQDESDEVFAQAMQLYQERNLEDAAKMFENLLKRFPNSRVAPEAQYRLGTIAEEKADYRKAFAAYKVIVESFPQSERLNEVIEREYRIANLFLAGKKGKVMGLEILPSLPKAVEIFKHIVDHAPYSEYGDKAQFHLGIAYRKWGRYAQALEAFQALIDQYPQSELVPDARYQLAETAFQKSVHQFRDQRALDEAADQTERFLAKHPDSEVSEQAARFRQEIDEKNAEKNYRIGLYYEKTDYLGSALVYYRDVAQRYPQTQWGQKASDKLRSLEEPALFHSKEAQKVQEEITVLREKLMALPDPKTAEGAALNRQLERLEDRQKNVEQDKDESIKSRRQDLKRREMELKEKFKKLNQKKKLMKKNPSEDLKEILDRWETSLEGEKAALMEEKRQLADWLHQLGEGSSSGTWLDYVPFVKGPSSEVERVRRIEARKYFKVSHEKKEVLSEKELLYKHHSEVLYQIQDTEGKKSQVTSEQTQVHQLDQKTDAELTKQYEILKAIESEMKELEAEMDKARALYERHYESGWKAWVKKPANLVSSSTRFVAKPIANSLTVINPFDSRQESLSSLSLEEALERRMHLKEKIEAQRGLVDTLQQAFDSELAMQERKRLLDTLDSQEKVDPQQLRKAIRKLERGIRSRYDEIKDRHKRKRQLLKELDETLEAGAVEKGPAMNAMRTAAKPAVSILKTGKAFLVGLPHKEVELTQTAEKLKSDTEQSVRAKELKAEIESESLLIEARYREIPELQKELEILKAKASLAGGMKFRSAWADLPYSLIREAVDSANRLIPKKGRDEMLVHVLDEETQELTAMKEELAKIEQIIQEKSGGETTPSPKPVEETKPVETAASAETGEIPSEESLKAKMLSLSEQIEIKQKTYENEKTSVKMQERVMDRELNTEKLRKILRTQDQELTEGQKKLLEELNQIESSLQGLIQHETKLEQEESEILSKRMQQIDKLIAKTLSRAAVEDLMVERDRIQTRVDQIESRRNFLSQELSRFQMTEAAAPSTPNPS